MDLSDSRIVRNQRLRNNADIDDIETPNIPDTRSIREDPGAITFSMDADANKPVGTGEGAIYHKLITLKNASSKN